jgi:1,4-alpha-glucan branching enzyme
VVAFVRRDRRGGELLCVVNFSPNAYDNYRLGVPPHSAYVPCFSTDAPAFGGEGFGDSAPVAAEPVPAHGKDQSVVLRIPPFGGVFLRGKGKLPRRKETAAGKDAQKTGK